MAIVVNRSYITGLSPSVVRPIDVIGWQMVLCIRLLKGPTIGVSFSARITDIDVPA